MSPSSGTTGGGTAVTITGTNLGGATGVSFGGAAGKVTADSGTQITVSSPSGTGTVSITVTTPGGSASAGTFTYMTPAPAVTGLSPSSGTTAGGTAVTITGANLGGATVSFGGAAAKIAADSGRQIAVTSPPGSAGAVSVTVTTPGGASSGTFTYVIPAPAVTGVSPSSGTTAGGTAVTITGANLGGATVSFGGAAAKIAADSGTQIAVTSPPGSAGAVSVTVTTPGGTSSGNFTYVIPAPAISAISPSSGSTQGGTTVTISGANLAGASSVTFGGVAAKIAGDSGTQITVTSPPGTAGTVTVTVTTAGGTASASFTYTPPVIN